MDNYELKWTRLQIEIFGFLCVKAGEKFNLRSIAKNLKKSPTAISESLKRLEKEGFVNIKKSKVMNLMEIELNRDNPKVIELKRAENLRVISKSNLIEFLEENFPGSTIILFGSYSYGEDGVDSDVDIAIIGSNKKDINQNLKKFEKRIGREIRINFYSSFKEINNELKENLFNGIVLSGGVEL